MNIKQKIMNFQVNNNNIYIFKIYLFYQKFNF